MESCGDGKVVVAAQDGGRISSSQVEMRLRAVICFPNLAVGSSPDASVKCQALIDEADSKICFSFHKHLVK